MASVENRGMGGALARLPALLLQVLLVLLVLPPPCSSSPSLSASEFNRGDFPSDFVFGAGTSAYQVTGATDKIKPRHVASIFSYLKESFLMAADELTFSGDGGNQVEGAVDEDGRTPSIWDTFTHAGMMADGSSADVAADGYHHYKEDVKLMYEIGLEGYRFSISWSRLIPNGRGAVNQKAVEYYNSLLDELVKHGIKPYVTLFHFDLPQGLQDEYGGWLSPRIIEDFVAYANICFKEFGDRISYWTTFNEPNIFSIGSYDHGIMPPSRCSYPFGLVNCTAGNSTVEPYIAMRNFLLAHSSVVELYRTKYQATQKGLIGINLFTYGMRPRTNSTADLEATQRAFDFMFGWVLNPLVFGDYPEIMKEIAGSKIPSFTHSQSKGLKGSIDFIGINYYSSMYVSDNSKTHKTGLQDFSGDMSALISVSKDTAPSKQHLVHTVLPVDSTGLESLLLSLKRKYGNLPIYIHENGFGTPYNVTLNDTGRINAINSYIRAVLSAIRNGSNARGYFVWSFLDVFEILTGFQFRYGLYYVDFEDKKRRRLPKLSALWYRDFLKKTKDVMAF